MPRVTAGELFPDLSFETYAGESCTAKQAVRRRKHTIFWVMRFIGCRFCQYDIDLLAGQYARFAGKDTQVYVVLQSSRASIAGLKGELQVPFDVICDTKHAFYKALDIRATATKEDRMPSTPEGLAQLKAKQEAVSARNYRRKAGEGEAQQLPALFIVDAEGRVEYAHYAVHSIDIPGADELLELLEGLDAR